MNWFKLVSGFGFVLILVCGFLFIITSTVKISISHTTAITDFVFLAIGIVSIFYGTDAISKQKKQEEKA